MTSDLTLPYRGESWRTRLHVAARALTCPVAEVLGAVPIGGSLLDVGCGHGLLTLAAHNRGLDRAVGIDIDEEKIATARRVVPEGASVDFLVGSIGDVVAEVFDTVLVCDVLYLVPAADQRAWVDAVAARVAPGGTLVIKEMATTPAWKLRWTLVQERLATGVLGMTDGGSDGLCLRDPSEIARWLEADAFAVARGRLDRWRPWPHELTVAKRCDPSGRNQEEGRATG